MKNVYRIVVLCTIVGIILIGGFFALSRYTDDKKQEATLDKKQSETLYKVELSLALGTTETEARDELPVAWSPWTVGNYLAYILGLQEFDIERRDAFKDKISLVAYDITEGKLLDTGKGEAHMFNRSFYVLTKPGEKIDTTKAYDQDGVRVSISNADSELLPFIENQSYCEQDTDCAVSYNICSYGAHNKFRKYTADVEGCEGPSFTQENTEELIRACDPYTHHPVIEYTGASCINKTCVAQNRVFSCEEGDLP